MYGKEEASKLKQQFWITLGKYLKPIPSADGTSINWINYKTGIKHLFFRMNADQREAIISIEISHPDNDRRLYYFNQFFSYKAIFEEMLGEGWIWEAETVNEFGNSLSRIYMATRPVNVFNEQDWPKIISFLKPRMIALDEFWVDVKPFFETS